MTTGTIWIDLTDIYYWKGYLTGIQRVDFNISRRLYDRGLAKFFIYHERSRKFVEADFEPILQRYLTANAPTSLGTVARPSLRLRTKVRLRENYLKIRPETRAWLTPRVKPVAKAVSGKIYHTLYLAKQMRFEATDNSPEVQFTSNDNILVLGGEWGRPNFIDDLGRLRRRVGFKLFHFIHDVIPLNAPQFFGPGHFEISADYFFEAAAQCDALIYNSKSCRNEVEAFCQQVGLPRPQGGIVRLGDETFTEYDPSATPPDTRLTPGNFILCQGTIEMRKNPQLLYYVYKLAHQEGISLPMLAIVGKPGWLTSDVIYAFKHDPEVSGRVAILNGIDDRHSTWLFQNCRYTLFPAIYEGWGLPVAEALVHGKVCLASDADSVQEIAGDLLDYYSPFDARACFELMKRYQDDTVLARKEAEIKARYQVQTWDKTTDEVISVIEQN